VRELADGTLLLKGFVPRGKEPWDVIFVALKQMGGGRFERRPYRFQVHPHDREALVRAAGNAGLALRSLHGGFEGEDPADGASADLVYVFTNPSGPART
jgi:hypothetical protein